jgi:hypothetical protein
MVKQHKLLSLSNKKRQNYNHMKKYILSIILGVALLFTSNQLSAQPGFDDDIQDTPIDGGMVVLAIAGAAFGAKKMREE